MSYFSAQIFAEAAAMVELGSGYQPAEGPIWIKEEQCLIFSDVRGNTMYRWSFDNGVEVFRKPSGCTNGNTRDKQGRIVSCHYHTHGIIRSEPSGAVTLLIDNYQGKRLHSPNDIVVKSDHSIYFTDPPYGLIGAGQEHLKELAFNGVYRLDPETKDLMLLVDDFMRPNGLAFSPDESLLYINDTELCHIRVFDVNTDGSISNGRLFTAVESDPATGRPDGLKVDQAGNVYCTGAGGIRVYNPTGEELGLIPVPKKATNFTWGGDDGKTLFITCFDGLYRVPVKAPGIATI